MVVPTPAQDSGTGETVLEKFETVDIVRMKKPWCESLISN